MNEEQERLIRIEERYNILVNLLKRNIKKSGDYLILTNDRTIIEFLQSIEYIEEKEHWVIEDKTEYPF